MYDFILIVTFQNSIKMFKIKIFKFHIALEFCVIRR